METLKVHYKAEAIAGLKRTEEALYSLRCLEEVRRSQKVVGDRPEFGDLPMINTLLDAVQHCLCLLEPDAPKPEKMTEIKHDKTVEMPIDADVMIQRLMELADIKSQILYQSAIADIAASMGVRIIRKDDGTESYEGV